MIKRKLSFSVFFGFFLCSFSALVSGSNVLNHLRNSNSVPTQDSECSFKCEDFKALQNQNQELIKTVAKLKEKVNELKNRDAKAWILESAENGQPRATNEDPGISAPQSKSITSCSIAMETLLPPRSKKQVIYLHGNGSNNNSRSLEVLCDFENDGGGWTLIQKRSRGPREEFKRNWTDYANGFSSLDENGNGNFWVGLENIHALTKNGDQELRIELEDFQGEKRFAKYTSFSVSNASDSYRLAISGFSKDSTAGDSMTDSNYPWGQNDGTRFSTWDKDNDEWSGVNCAGDFGGGGWWFSDCGSSGLNGLWFEEGETKNNEGHKGIHWLTWRGSQFLAKSEMKIRSRKSESSRK